MRRAGWLAAFMVAWAYCSANASAQSVLLSKDDQATLDALGVPPLVDPATPILADDAVSDSTIYATPPPPKGDEGVNNGGTHFDLKFAYLNAYVYRGVNHDSVATHGSSLNLTLEGRLEFDTGKYPHPFVGVFSNIYDSDPVSRFQEFRPYVGATWDLHPFLIEECNVEYIYPDREQDNLPEAYLKLTFDDSFLFRTPEPIVSPYNMGAYDYYRNDGWYTEAGVHHDFFFEDWGLTLTPQADVAWISGLPQQFVIINRAHDSGWQHGEVGVVASYSLNNLLNLSMRYGEFDINSYVFYDQRISAGVTANTLLWGGAGLGFRY